MRDTKRIAEEDRLHKAEEIVRSVGVPAQPAVLVEVSREIHKPHVSLEGVAAIMTRDVSLSARVLKLASSPLFGGRQAFTNVRDALVLLGLNHFYRSVLTVALRDSLKKTGGDHEAFWQHSQQVSAICQVVAEGSVRELAAAAATLGLFHDIGTVLLQRKYPDYTRYAAGALAGDWKSVRAEDRRYGTDHGAAGYIVAKTWGLAPLLLEVILHHHETDYDLHTDPVARQLKAILQLSELFWNRDMRPGASQLIHAEHDNKVVGRACAELGLETYHLDELEDLVADALGMEVL